MQPFSFIRQVFSLDTLDSRFTENTARSSSPPKPSNAPSIAGPSQESRRSQQLREEASSPRWKTPEFALYYLVFLVCVPLMFKAAYDVSKESHPNYHIYEHLLSPGWIPGRKVDNSDTQYASFRDNIPILFVVLCLHFLLRRAYDFLFTRIFPTPPSNSSYLPSHNITRRKIFDVFFALVFLFALHAFSVIKILFILLVNFLISYFHPSSILNPIFTWIFNIGILFANEWADGYRFRHILPWLVAGEGSGFGYAVDHAFGGGLLPRWQISFNITILRLISYNMDHYWAAVRLEEGETEEGSVLEVGGLRPQATEGEDAEPEGPQVPEASSAGDGQTGVEERLIEELKKKQADPANMSERDRVDTPAQIDDYGLLNYLAYILYSPLYLAGPIVSFNDFVHQQRYPLPSTAPARTIKYGIRLLLDILCMELVLHFLYVVAIAKTNGEHSWAGDSPAQLCMIGYFNLHIIWLKLLIPWRFFRLWALVDSVDPPENMIRCMSNNFSALAFWRSWHRSFNRWITRYIYIPLGGARRPLVNMAAVFTFVALWHDLSFRLLAWGWMIVIFVAPEIFLRKIFSRKKFEGRETLYRHLGAIGAVANVLMMMAANLVGFAIGLDGLRELVRGVLGSWEGAVFAVTACSALFVGVQVMFEIREDEQRGGINLKC